MDIPEKAVEAALGALDASWIEDANREQLREMMRNVLEAAAPEIMAATNPCRD